MPARITGVRNPPRIIIEFPDVPGREPYIIWNKEEALQAFEDHKKAIKVFED